MFLYAGIVFFCMALYRLKNVLSENPGELFPSIYARNPGDIIGLIRYYHEREGEKNLTRPDTAAWVKNIPTLENIETVDKGSFCFHVGYVRLPTAQDEERLPLYEELPVLPDFSVGVTLESAHVFADFRKTIPSKKRANLYKIDLRNVHLLSSFLTFVPEGVVRAVVDYDMTDVLAKGREYRESIEAVKRGHPNLL